MLTTVIVLCLAQAAPPVAAPARPLTYEYLGKKMTPTQVRTSAKKYNASLLAKPNANVIGKLVQAEGSWLQDETGAAGIVVSTPNKPPTTIPLQLSRFADLQMRSGLNLKVYGILGKEGIDAWFLDLAPPGLQWASQLQNPGMIVAGARQTFHVDIVVKNTGKQPLARVSGVCRLWQQESPNDWTEQLEFENLLPGETRTITVPFEIFNYQYIGKTSLPQCAFTVVDFE